MKKVENINVAQKTNLRLGAVISRFLCYFGVHKMRIGLGWSGIKRFDTCYHCKYSIWVEDIEGNKKIHDELQKHLDSKLS
jgi:hypothetical protein